MLRFWLLVILLIPAIAGKAHGSGDQPVILALNTWTQISTPDTPLDKKHAPRLLKEFVGSYTHARVYAIRLEPGQSYTLQTEYLGDGQYAQAKVYGNNPFSLGRSSYAPSGTSYVGISRARSFPGGKIKGITFGRHANFMVSDKSQHNWAFILMGGKTPNVAMRIRIIHPPVPDDQVKAKGAYRIKPDGKTEFSFGQIHTPPLWLGYAQQAPPLPFPWEIEQNQTDIRISGPWQTPLGDLEMIQDNVWIKGLYPDKTLALVGYFKGAGFTGYWTAPRADTRCKTYLLGNAYWGRLDLTHSGGRLQGRHHPCGHDTGQQAWVATAAGAAAAGAAAAGTAPLAAPVMQPETSAKGGAASTTGLDPNPDQGNRMWKQLPDFEFISSEE